MANSFPAFVVEEATPLRNEDYFWFVLDKIERAKWRIWISVFIIDITREGDPDLRVRTLIRSLSRAAWNGVSVRVLTGDPETLWSVHEMNKVARMFLRSRRIPTLRHPSPGRQGSHDKYVLFDDDLIVVGSHNWTHRAFTLNDEESVAVKSRGLAIRLEKEFLSNWNRPAPTASATAAQPGGSN